MRLLAFAIMLMSLITHSVFAADETPLSLDGVRVVSAEELKTMVEQGTARVYDFRKKASFVEGHVPGAMSGAPYYDERDTTLDTSFLPSDRNDRIVFYSHGTTGWKSYYAAKQAREAGYRNVLWMRGGYAEWEENELPIER